MEYIIPIDVTTIPLIVFMNSGRLPELDLDSTYFVVEIVPGKPNYTVVMNDEELADRTNNHRTKDLGIRAM